MWILRQMGHEVLKGVCFCHSVNTACGIFILACFLMFVVLSDRLWRHRYGHSISHSRGCEHAFDCLRDVGDIAFDHQRYFCAVWLP